MKEKTEHIPDQPAPKGQQMRRNVRAYKRRARVVTLLLLLFFVFCFLWSFVLGRYDVSIPVVVKILLSPIFPIEPTWERNAEIAVLTVRLPRILTAALVGACLSVAGLSFQSLFKNPMALPDILGASSGAGFGAALAIYYGASAFGVSCSAFAFGLACVGIAYLASLRMKNSPVLGLILSGIIVSALFNAGVSYLKLVADVEETLPAITYWLMGSFADASYSDLKIVILPMAVGLIGLLVMRWRLSVMSLGDDEAQSLGVNVRASRMFVVLFATLITTASVSVSGVIGWVGLVIPHFCRILVGEDHRYLMPASLLLGAGFMLLVDNIARSISTIDIPVGILTAFLGCNGAGKSTIFRCILGLLHGYQGKILVDGRDVRTLRRAEQARLLAYIPQSSEPAFNFSVFDVVLMGRTAHMRPGAQPTAKDEEIVFDVMDRLGISYLATCGYAGISGGERQMALIARALAQQAGIVIMDEPTANLDMGNQHLVMQQVMRLKAEGYLIILSTHNPQQALSYADRVLVLQEGRILLEGPAREVLTEQTLKSVYGVDFDIFPVTQHNGVRRQICVPSLDM